jgi:hypothetical protein
MSLWQAKLQAQIDLAWLLGLVENLDIVAVLVVGADLFRKPLATLRGMDPDMSPQGMPRTIKPMRLLAGDR